LLRKIRNNQRIIGRPLNISERGAVYSMKITPEIIPNDIKPGMEGSVDIIVGTRTVMEYILETFLKLDGFTI
jgi:multidrug efflux pump subunit AcrA (membrane-fusion protein)